MQISASHIGDAFLTKFKSINSYKDETEQKNYPNLGMWAEQLRRSVKAEQGKRQDKSVPSIRHLCKEIGMSERIYRQVVAGESTNLRNYLRIIFWCIDHYPSGRREQLMQELVNRLRSEFE